MIIYLRHERHGTKVAISDLEAEQDEKNGWVRYDPTPLQSVPVAQIEEERQKRKYTRRA